MLRAFAESFLTVTMGYPAWVDQDFMMVAISTSCGRLTALCPGAGVLMTA